MVKYGSTVVLIDVGIPGKYVMAGLERNGLDLPDVDGILVTHEHTDHVQSIRMISRRAENAVVHASRGTLLAVQDRLPEDRTHEVHIDEDFYIGEILVVPFDLSHDATEPMGYSLLAGGQQVTIVTDTGCLTDEIMHHIRTSDLLVLEANHDEEMLAQGPYPAYLKGRIRSGRGHLSNRQCADALTTYASPGLRHVWLCHLSEENNHPVLARKTVEAVLRSYGLVAGSDFQLTVLNRQTPTGVFELDIPDSDH
jgi:phosphoribosyl 1,2-cyclic phosphodiesterase